MDAGNIVEAASNGASQAIPLVANIAAMLIAFVSFIEWLNSAVAWAGECVGQGKLVYFYRSDIRLNFVFQITGHSISFCPIFSIHLFS